MQVKQIHWNCDYEMKPVQLFHSYIYLAFLSKHIPADDLTALVHSLIVECFKKYNVNEIDVLFCSIFQVNRSVRERPTIPPRPTVFLPQEKDRKDQTSSQVLNWLF